MSTSRRTARPGRRNTSQQPRTGAARTDVDEQPVATEVHEPHVADVEDDQIEAGGEQLVQLVGQRRRREPVQLSHQLQRDGAAFIVDLRPPRQRQLSRTNHFQGAHLPIERVGPRC